MTNDQKKFQSSMTHARRIWILIIGFLWSFVIGTWALKKPHLIGAASIIWIGQTLRS